MIKSNTDILFNHINLVDSSYINAEPLSELNCSSRRHTPHHPISPRQNH